MENVMTGNRETRKDAAERLKGEIIKALKCTPDQYAQFQYNEGRKYIKHFLPGDAAAAAMLERSRAFWAWWKNHWANRDERFLELNSEYPGIKANDAVLQIYLHWNDGTMLAGSIHPNSVILNETCEEMVRGVINDDSNEA